LEDEFIKKYLYDYIQMVKVRRRDIDKFIWDKLSDVLDEKKKKNKIKNLLQDLRKDKKIHSPQFGIWESI
jgi:ATP-dependent DNA helicase RecG